MSPREAEGDHPDSWTPEQWVDFAVARDDEKERGDRCAGLFVIEVDNPSRFKCLPLLRWIEPSGVSYVYRQATTRRELNRHLRQWRQDSDNYPVLAINGHGSSGRIYLGGQESDVGVSLIELARTIGPTCGRSLHVHFGGCEVVRNREAVFRFLRVTGIGSVSGFCESVATATSQITTLLIADALIGARQADTDTRLRVRWAIESSARGVAAEVRLYDRGNLNEATQTVSPVKGAKPRANSRVRDSHNRAMERADRERAVQTVWRPTNRARRRTKHR
jgi:hypothetical protein